MDRDFGNGGRTLTNFGTSIGPGRAPNLADDRASFLTVAPDGSIVVAGTSTAAVAANPPRPRWRSPATTPTGNSIADSANVAGSSPSSAPTSRTSSGWRSTAPATSWWPYPPAPPTRSRTSSARQSAGAGKSRNAARHGEARDAAVRGTSGTDEITVASKSTGFLTVTVDGVSRASRPATSDIVVSDRAGDDVLTIESSVSIPAQLLGGAGNDSFFSRDAASDRLLGGPGTDVAQKDDLDVARSVESLVA